MHIEHIAIWTGNLEQLKTFYETYFNGLAGEKYINPKKQFESYFTLSLPSVSHSILNLATVRYFD